MEREEVRGGKGEGERREEGRKGGRAEGEKW